MQKWQMVWNTNNVHVFILNNVTEIGKCRINKIKPSTVNKALSVIIIILYEITIFIMIYVIIVFITLAFVSH